MITTYEDQLFTLREFTSRILHELRFGIHRLGYKQLLLLIPCYALDDNQSFTKELYPYVADYFGYSTWHPIEHTVRDAILNAWANRDPAVWEQYFPDMQKPPSNKQFIATIAERIKNTPPV